MKKFLIISSLLLIGSLSASAYSLSTIVTNGAMTNLIVGFNGSARVSQITVAAGAGDVTVKLVDTSDGNLSWTNVSYTTITPLATNSITSWTNFFGTVNYMTNQALVYRTNTVAAATNAWPVRLTLTASTNQTVVYENVNYYFNNGIYATNNGTATATINVVFQQ